MMIKKLFGIIYSIYTLLFIALSIPLLHSMEDPRPAEMEDPRPDEVIPRIPNYSAGERDPLDGILSKWDLYCYDPVNHVYHLDEPSEAKMFTNCGQSALYYAKRTALKLATNPRAPLLTLTQYFYDSNPAFDLDHPGINPSLYDPRGSEDDNARHLGVAREFISKLTSYGDIDSEAIQNELNKETLYPRNIRQNIFLYTELLDKFPNDDRDGYLAQRKCVQKVVNDPTAYCIFIEPWLPDTGGHWCTIAIRSTGKDGPLETLFADGMRWPILLNNPWLGRNNSPDISVAQIHQKVVAPTNILRFRSFLTKLHDGTLSPRTLSDIRLETSMAASDNEEFKRCIKALRNKIPGNIPQESLTTTPTELRTLAEVPDPQAPGSHRAGRPLHTTRVLKIEIHPNIKRLQDCIRTLYQDPDPLYKQLQKAWAAWARRTHPGLSAEDELREEAAIARRQKEREDREDVEIGKILPLTCDCGSPMTTLLSLPCGSLYQHATPVMPEDYKDVPPGLIPKPLTQDILCYGCTLKKIASRQLPILNTDPPQNYSFQCGCKGCSGFLSSNTIALLRRQTSSSDQKHFAYACAKYHGDRWGAIFNKKYFTTFPLDEVIARRMEAEIRGAQHPRHMRLPFSDLGECTMGHIVSGSAGDNPMTGLIQTEAQMLLRRVSIAANQDPEPILADLTDDTMRDITPLFLNDLFKQRDVFYSKIDPGKIPTPIERTLFLLVRLYQCDEHQNQPVDSLKNLILYGTVYGELEGTPQGSGLSSTEIEDLTSYCDNHGSREFRDIGGNYAPIMILSDLPWTDEHRVRRDDLRGVSEILGKISEEKKQAQERTVRQYQQYLANVKKELTTAVTEEAGAVLKSNLNDIISELSNQEFVSNTMAQHIVNEAKRLLQEKFPEKTSPDPKPEDLATAGPIVLKLETMAINFDDDTPSPTEPRKGQLATNTNVTIGSILHDIASILGIPEGKISFVMCPPDRIDKADFETKKLSSMQNIQKQPLKIRVSILKPTELTKQRPELTLQPPNKLEGLKTALKQLQAKLTGLKEKLTRLKL